MMESGLKDETARPEMIVVEDLRRNLSSEFGECSDMQNPADLEKEHLKVYLRIRPFSAAEIENGESQDCVAIQLPETVLLKAPRSSLSARLSDKSLPVTAQRFQFSKVYGPDTRQKEMFDGTVRSLVKDVLEGQNSLVFTYGVTNAGKTFTYLGPDSNPGILPCSLNMIFGSLEGRIFNQMCLKPQRCRDFIRLTKEQQNEEAASKRNLLRLFKETDAHKNTSCQSSKSDLEDGSSLCDISSTANENSFALDMDMDINTKFSVWVSFCEIYNENIHDLLEQNASNALRRTNLRLCQDVKGNAFIKDLKWVQVNSADEAFKVMKLGKRNQSISSTKLNLLSSRSHSIFSVRILKVEDVGIPRVESVSELALCDLAGSERCAKTQNKGDRLKEAGNINTSLLSLGKCINALRNNQQARQHVPFRESKLTHYLQGYFTGRGKACMIVNINQCASMYDETLNVLKFSAVAQKVVVLTTKIVPVVVKRSAREVSFIINNVDRRALRRSSLVRWDPSLEDVQEDSDTEEEDEEGSEMEDTIQDAEDEGKETVLLDKQVYEAQLQLIEEIQQQLRKERTELFALETRVREEVTKEFSELISHMQEDYSERISRERELIEERCERRLEILKNLVGKTSGEEDCVESAGIKSEENHGYLDGMLDSISNDLVEIRQSAQAAQSCLVTPDPRVSVPLHDLEKKVMELSEQLSEAQSQLSLKTQELETQSRLSDELEDMKKTTEMHGHRQWELTEMCSQKDEMISRLQTALDNHVETTAQDRSQIDSIKKEIIHLKSICTCSGQRPSSRTDTRKRRQEGEGIDGQPPLKKGPLEDLTVQEDISDNGCQDSSLLEVKGHLEDCHINSKHKDKQITDLEQECNTLKVCIQELKSKLEEHSSQEHFLQEKDYKRERKLTSVETKPAMRLIDQSNLKAEVVSMETNHSSTTELLESLHRELAAAKSQMAKLDHEMGEKNKLITTLKQEVTSLKQEVETFARDLQLCREELTAARQQCAEKQQESNGKDERLKELENQINELQSTYCSKKSSAGNDDSEKVHSDVTALHVVIGELEEKLRCLQKDKQDVEKEIVLSQRDAGTTNQLKNPKEFGSENKELDCKTNITLSEKAGLVEKEKALALKEAQLAALQKSLKEAQERLEEEEMQAVQEARRREVERRRELLAVAEEAIAQKDAELQKRQEEINRLKEEIKTSEQKVNNLTVDLRRKDDDSSDLREKVCDSKKQIQQVQKEISSMRDAEKSLRLKLSDMEKIKTQLQNEVSSRDRVIHQLRTEQSSNSKSDENLLLHQKACKDLQECERVIEDMRLALTEQEETQTQLDLELENREAQIIELTEELTWMKEVIPDQKNSRDSRSTPNDILQSRRELTQAQESLQLSNEKHLAERKKWMEEKLVLIGQVKEAEERRNQDMRRYADYRERHVRQQAEMESLAAQLSARDNEMEGWRKERDALVSALEVQLKKLILANAEKDKQIQILQSTNTSQTPEVTEDSQVEALQAELDAKDVEIQRLKEEPRVNVTESSMPRHSSTQTIEAEFNDIKPLNSSTLKHTRGSVTSQSSTGSCPLVLDSSVISTETGRRSRFPRPEMEISFSPLQPDRFALKRQGEDSAVTVKIPRTRKRKSGDMEKDGVESENIRNTRSRNTPRLMPHQEESSNSQESNSGHKGKKDKTLQKIGDFLHGSPTFLGSKAKRIMGLMSGKSPDGGGASLKIKRSRQKHDRPDISSPMDIHAHQIIGRNPEVKESENLIKKRLRTRTGK